RGELPAFVPRWISDAATTQQIDFPSSRWLPRSRRGGLGNKCVDSASYCARMNMVALSYKRNLLTVFHYSTDRSHAVFFTQRVRPADMAPLRPNSIHARARALADQGSLEFRQGGHDMEHQSPA